MKKERRFVSKHVELRSLTDGQAPMIFGHAAVFNSMTDIGGFFEVLEPGTFSNVLANQDEMNQCMGLFNHDPNFVLGAVANATASAREDNIGLYYEIQTDPDNAVIQSQVVAPLKRGDIGGSSFAFMVENADWSETFQGMPVRRITSVSALFDFGPVTYPAYNAASSAVRSLLNAPTPEEIEQLRATETRQESHDAATLLMIRELRLRRFNFRKL